MAEVGRKTWVIADGLMPPSGSVSGGDGHETACLLNADDEEAHVALTIYFVDRDPVGPYHVTVPASRVVHQRFNELSGPEPVPEGTPYAAVITSDIPIVVQHTRQSAAGMLSTVAWAADATPGWARVEE